MTEYACTPPSESRLENRDGEPGEGRETTREEPTARAPAKRRIFPVLFLILVGTALSAGGYVVTDGLNRAANQNRFEKDANAIFDRIEMKISSTVEVLHSVAGLFVASGDVDRKEFRSFVRSLGALPSIHALEWVPRTTPCSGEAQPV